MLNKFKDYLPVYENLLFENMRFIADRFEAEPDYPFIDTKVHLFSGKDFRDEQFKGKDLYRRDIIFGWIQGRGIQAVASHLAWLQEAQTLNAKEVETLSDRLEKVLRDVVSHLEKLRQDNGGRFYFINDLQGKPLNIDAAGRIVPLDSMPQTTHKTDLFMTKGLIAAAKWLGNDDLSIRSMDDFEKMLQSIAAGNCATDQISFDPKNPSSHIPGRLTHADHMISLEGLGMLAELTDKSRWTPWIIQYVEHVLDRYVNTGQVEHLHHHDFMEYIDAEGQPWDQDGIALCDPGHAIEITGLAIKALRLIEEQAPASASSLINRSMEVFPQVLKGALELGWMDAGGICKNLDLNRREPYNSDMPWWNLPEGMRAILQVLAWDKNSPVSTELTDFYHKCHQSFIEHFIQPDLYHLAYQTRNQNGDPVDMIPACPDADPGYHTGLSLIDVCRELTGS